MGYSNIFFISRNSPAFHPSIASAVFPIISSKVSQKIPMQTSEHCLTFYYTIFSNNSSDHSCAKFFCSMFFGKFLYKTLRNTIPRLDWFYLDFIFESFLNFFESPGVLSNSFFIKYDFTTNTIHQRLL